MREIPSRAAATESGWSHEHGYRIPVHVRAPAAFAALLGAFVGVSGDTTLVRAGRTQSLGITGGYLVSAIGVGMLVSSLSIMATHGDSPETLEPSSASEQAQEPPPTQQPAAEPTRTQKPTASAPGPSEVVESYFEAINDHDYRKAWELGGKNLNSSYSSFAQGFEDTAHDEWTTTSLDEHTVHGELEATQADGGRKLFVGQYHVSNGTITSASLTEE